MMKSPMLPDYDTHGYEFDPHLHFAQFLKEAKTQSGMDVANQQTYVDDDEEKEELDASRRKKKKKKKKKSWRRSLLSWLKSDKKTTKSPVINNEPPNGSKPIRPYVSGPVNGGGGGSRRPSRSACSGPLSGLFNSNNKMEQVEDENNIPYVCIQNPPSPSVQSYGPVYLVT